MLIYHSCDTQYPIDRFIQALDKFKDENISIAFIEEEQDVVKEYDLYIYPTLNLIKNNPWKVHIGIFGYDAIDECEYFLYTRISRIIWYQGGRDNHSGLDGNTTQIKTDKHKTIIHHSFYNIDGWKHVMKRVIPTDIILIDFLDELSLYREYLPLAYPWIGIVHYGTDDSHIHSSLNSSRSLDKTKTCITSLQDPDIVFSLTWAKKIITLSQDLKDKIKNHLSIPIEVRYHPYLTTSYKFDMAHFLAQPHIIVMGGFRRDNSKIELLDKLLSRHNISIVYKTDKKLNYDKMIKYICKSILFSWYLDVSASMLILEAIHHHIPIIVNRKPAIEEYLGVEYPLYVDLIDHQSDLLLLIQKAWLYLTRLDKTKFSFDVFLNGLYD